MSKFEVYKDRHGKYRFRLKAVNGQVIAHGQGYANKIGCLETIEIIKEIARDAIVVEVSE